MSFLPPKDREHLEDKGIVFEEHEEGGQKGVILKARPCPMGGLMQQRWTSSSFCRRVIPTPPRTCSTFCRG